MKGELHQIHLDFIERAKEFFEEDHRRFTYFTKSDDLIALRYGDDNDCIRLFELGVERGFFHNIMEKCPVETIRKEDRTFKPEAKQLFHTGTNGDMIADKVNSLIEEFMTRYGLEPNTVYLGANQIISISECNKKVTHALGLKVVYLEDQDKVSVGLSVE